MGKSSCLRCSKNWHWKGATAGNRLAPGSWREATKSVSPSCRGWTQYPLFSCCTYQSSVLSWHLLKLYPQYLSSFDFHWHLSFLFRSSWKWLMIVVWMQKPQVGIVVPYRSDTCQGVTDAVWDWIEALPSKCFEWPEVAGFNACFLVYLMRAFMCCTHQLTQW